MEEGRDRPSEVPSGLTATLPSSSRNGGGPRSALGGPRAPFPVGGGASPAMEEGRDRPSEGRFLRIGGALTKTRNGGGPRSALGGVSFTSIYDTPAFPAMEEGRDRPSEVPFRVDPMVGVFDPQWRRAEIGPRRPTPLRAARGLHPPRNGGGPRSALGGPPNVTESYLLLHPQWRRAEIGPRRHRRRSPTGYESDPRNGGGPRSALGGGDVLPPARTLPTAAMEEGRDRPSEGEHATDDVIYTEEPQWRRAEIGPRRPPAKP